MMDRRAFIRALAAALPSGVAATAVESETDPVRAAYATLKAVIEETAPDGMVVLDQIHLINGNIVASAFPSSWEPGQRYAIYQSNHGGWGFKA